MAGGDLRTMQELMGHKTITMTLRYSHLSPAHKLAAVQRLARPATGTTTGTETTAKKPPAEAPSQISTAPADSRAGDRGRTGDVELGKLIDEGPEDYDPWT